MKKNYYKVTLFEGIIALKKEILQDVNRLNGFKMNTHV